MTNETQTIPPDDVQRKLALARPNEDQKLPHIGLAGDTYTILLTGKDTAGRYCLIDMLVPAGGGPPPHRHDFEEMFTLLDGEIEVTFRGATSVVRAGETANIPANAPHHFRNASGDRRGCCACVHQPGKKRILWQLAFPSLVAPIRPRNSTRPARRRSKRKLKRSLHNTGRNFYTLHSDDRNA